MTGAGLDVIVNQLPSRRLSSCRLRQMPTRAVAVGPVPVASSLASRLVGLSWLDRAEAPAGLLIPRCRSVHTFGMRFPLDVIFLDDHLREISRREALPPRRFAFERRADAVLEVPA
jgi:uncharacterized protein